MKRKGLSQKLRFEVFKRDSFRCQYCGRVAPDVILHADHLHPVSKGGEDDILNLVTSCSECNGGKGARMLDDHAVLDKQREQLEELNQRREQLEMMISWRDGLADIDGQRVDAIVARYDSKIPGWHTNDGGRKKVHKWIAKFPIDVILEAIDHCGNDIVLADGVATETSVLSFKDAVSKRMFFETERRRNPDGARLYYIRGILRNTCSRYLPEWEAMDDMRRALASGVRVEDIEDAAKHCSSWTNFASRVDDLIVMAGERP